MLEVNFINGAQMILGTANMEEFNKGIQNMSPNGRFLSGIDFSINVDNVTMIREISEEEYNARLQRPPVEHRGPEQVLGASVKKEEQNNG